MIRFAASFALLAAAVAAGTADPASARRSSLLDGLPALTAEDRAMARETAQERLAEEPVGTTLSWENPASGNSGTVTLMERFERDGRECHYNRHNLRVRQDGALQRQQWDFVICRQPDGGWAIE